MQAALDDRAPAASTRRVASPLRALVAFEWLAHGRLITLALVVWAAFLWVLPFFTAPQFLLAFGLAYAALVASRVAGSDVLEGTTEHTLGLPFTRRQLYWTRAALAGLPLALVLGIGLLALRYEWVQAIWSLVVESGFTESFAARGAEPGSFPWYSFSFALPVLSFACTFVMAALSSSPRAQPLLWCPGLLAAVVVVSTGLAVETGLWGDPTGWVTVPLALVGSGVVLLCGAMAFERKDAPGAAARGDSRLWPTALGLLAAIAVLVVGLLFAIAAVSRQEALRSEREAREARARHRAEWEAQKSKAADQERDDNGDAPGKEER